MAEDQQIKGVDAPVGFMRRVGYLLGPVALTAVVAGVIFLVADERTMHEALVAAGASLFGMGTTVVFGKAVIGDTYYELSLGNWDLAFVVMYVNAVSAYWYTWNLDLLQKVPGIGPSMRQARKNAVQTLRRRPWIRRWAVVGVGLFVITPLPGSGALGGSLMGRIMGVSKQATFISVSVAGVIVSSVYALAADRLEALLNRVEQFAPAWVRITVAGLVVLVTLYLMTRLVRWFASHPPETDGDTQTVSDTVEAPE